MSLLMDALRRAEEAKRLATSAHPPAASVAAVPGELALDPVDGPNIPPEGQLPPLAIHREAIDADLAAGAGTPPPRRRPLSSEPTVDDGLREAERRAARNVFAVKQETPPRTALWIFVAFAGVATLAIIGYFWWQLQSVGVGTLSAPLPSEVATAPATAPAPVSAAAPARPLELPMPPAPTTGADATTVTPRQGQAQPSAASTANVASPLERSTSEAGRSRLAEAPPPPRLAGSRARADETIDYAYDALQANRLDESRRAYEQVLRSDSRNVDALLGMAVIATRQGQNERAQQWYQRALEANPADVSAQAALINLRAAGDAGNVESRLKTLLASQPDSPGAHFALGNVYARQGRWSEAQQAYFQAYVLEPENADYLYNIAVSLDHLRQGKLAAQYYRMALAAAEKRRGAFDEDAAGKRLLDLQR